MVDEAFLKKYGNKAIKKRTPLSQEVRKAIITLLFCLVLITVVLSIIFMLNTSNSAQKGYIHSQLILQNEELENKNKILKTQVIKAKSMLNIEDSEKADYMDEAEDGTFVN